MDGILVRGIELSGIIVRGITVSGKMICGIMVRGIVLYGILVSNAKWHYADQFPIELHCAELY